jgi:hypothetical protein
MGVDEAKAPAEQLAALYQVQDFAILRSHGLGQTAKPAEKAGAVGESAHGNLAGYERVAEDILLEQLLPQRRIVPPQMIDPDTAVDEKQADLGRPAPGTGSRVRIAAAEAGEPARRLALDQRLQRFADKRRFFLDPGIFLSVGDELVVEGEGGAHDPSFP